MAPCLGSETKQRRLRLQRQLLLLRLLRIRRPRGLGLTMCRHLAVGPLCQSLGLVFRVSSTSGSGFRVEGS
jgi:hypothetical protein